jgi:Protein of unknown function (DUF2442)
MSGHYLSPTLAHNKQPTHPGLHACPLCRQLLSPAGLTIDGWPLWLPKPDDLRAVEVTVSDTTIAIRFASGLVASRPLAYSRRLSEGTPEQRNAVEIDEWGHLHWEALDEDMDTTIFLGFAEDLGAAGRCATFWPTSARTSRDEP